MLAHAAVSEDGEQMTSVHRPRHEKAGSISASEPRTKESLPDRKAIKVLFQKSISRPVGIRSQ